MKVPSDALKSYAKRPVSSLSYASENITKNPALRRRKKPLPRRNARCDECVILSSGLIGLEVLSEVMELKAEIQEAVKQSMKSGDRVTLSTLRLLLSAVHNEEIRVRGELSKEDIQRTITTLCKQRTEAIDLYRKGGREDLAQKEEAEFAVLKRFLPEQLTEEEVKNLIQACIAEAGAKGVQDLGKVMKLVMPKVAGRSDGKRVNELAKGLLAG